MKCMPLEIITGSRRSPDDNAALRSTISDHRCIVNMDPGFRRGDNHAFAVRLFISISPFPSLPSPFAPFSISPFSLLTSQFALHFHFSLRFPPSHFAVFSIPYPPSPIPSLSTIYYPLSTIPPAAHQPAPPFSSASLHSEAVPVHRRCCPPYARRCSSQESPR